MTGFELSVLFHFHIIFFFFISVLPDMTSSKIAIIYNTENMLTITFKQLIIEASLAEYYFYKVECRREDTDDPLPNLPQLPHINSLENLIVAIDGLAPGTTYIIKVVPYREVACSDFSNSGLEAGIPSGEATITMGEASLIDFCFYIQPLIMLIILSGVCSRVRKREKKTC